jgi:hypothetical protein
MARHTFATRYLRKGGRLETLSMVMGHESIRTTYDLYAHLDMRDAALDMALIEADGSFGTESSGKSCKWGGSRRLPESNRCFARHEGSPAFSLHFGGFRVRLAYADPPYPGRAHLYADHPDYAGEVDHRELALTLATQYDGWALSTSAESLPEVFNYLESASVFDFRVLAWVKHTVTVSWEPVIVVSARKPEGMRDWIQVEPDSYQWREKPDSYVIGQKPEAFCRWVFEWLGAEATTSWTICFPGSGNVGRAWESWRAQPGLLIARSRRLRSAPAAASSPRPTSPRCLRRRHEASVALQAG